MKEALTVKQLTEVHTHFDDQISKGTDDVVIVGELAEQEADEFMRAFSQFSDPFGHAKRIKLPGIDRNTLEIVPRDVGVLFEKVSVVLGEEHALGMFEAWLEAQAINAGPIPPIRDTSIPAEAVDPEQEGESNG